MVLLDLRLQPLQFLFKLMLLFFLLVLELLDFLLECLDVGIVGDSSVCKGGQLSQILGEHGEGPT